MSNGELVTRILAFLAVAAFCAWTLYRTYRDTGDRRAMFGMVAFAVVVLFWPVIAWPWQGAAWKGWALERLCDAYTSKMMFIIVMWIILLKPALVIKRLLWMIPTLFIISVISFIIIQLPPGDYLTSYISALESTGETVSMEEVENLRVQFGLDTEPIPQYIQWMTGWAFANQPGTTKIKDVISPEGPVAASALAPKVVADGSTRALLTWPAVEGADGYFVLRKEGATEWRVVNARRLSGSPYLDMGLTASATYQYRVAVLMTSELASFGAAPDHTFGDGASAVLALPTASDSQTVTTAPKKWQERTKGLLRGDMGKSMEWNKPVRGLISERITLTMVISIATLLFSWALAIPIGIYSAVKQYSVFDYIFTFVGFIGIAIPTFLFALVLMYVYYAATGESVGGLFSQGMQNEPWGTAKFLDLLKHIWIPVTIIGVNGTAGLIRVMRGNLLDELRKQYVVTAQAKGLKRIRLLLKYPVRVALNPFVSTVGWVLPGIISGEVIVAMVLGLPTVGPLLLRALMNQDMYLAGSMVMILSALTVIGTLLSDLLLIWLDPRISYGERGE